MTPQESRNVEQDPRTRLHELLRSPELESLTRRNTPLTLDRLRTEAPALLEQLIDDEALEGAFAPDGALGWPDDSDVVLDTPNNGGNSMRPFRDYASPEEFAHFLHDARSRFDFPNKGLNNFFSALKGSPYEIGDEFDPSLGMQQLYTSKPCLLRARAIAPELFTTLRGVMDEQGIDDPVVAEAALTAYRLMGRLVRRDDISRQHRLLGFENGDKPITDVHEAIVE